MKRRPLSRIERGTILYGILSIVILIVLLQLWLLTATMNAYLGGDDTVVWPALAASAVCLMLNAGLLWYAYAIDRRPMEPPPARSGGPWPNDPTRSGAAYSNYRDT